MKRLTPPRGQLLLEVIVGLAILLGVFLVIAVLFPTTYDVSLQSARLTSATALARQVLERQKSRLGTEAEAVAALGIQTVSAPMTVQGRSVEAEFAYRLDSQGANPTLWKVTVQWAHSQKVREVVLVGPGRPP